MKIVDYIELNALAIIYSCTIGQVHLLVYYIKLQNHLSIHIFLSSGLSQNKIPDCCDDKVIIKFLTTVICCLQSIECYIVQAFYQEYLVNLTLITAKTNSFNFASLLWPKC